MNIIQLPPYLFCENRKEMPGAGVVLATYEPYIIGRVVQYESFEIMAHTIANSELGAHAIVPGYNVCIQFAGTIRGGVIPAKPKMMQAISLQMIAMAQFYLDVKIAEKPGWYKKKLKSFP